MVSLNLFVTTEFYFLLHLYSPLVSLSLPLPGPFPRTCFCWFICLLFLAYSSFPSFIRIILVQSPLFSSFLSSLFEQFDILIVHILHIFPHPSRSSSSASSFIASSCWFISTCWMDYKNKRLYLVRSGHHTIAGSLITGTPDATAPPGGDSWNAPRSRDRRVIDYTRTRARAHAHTHTHAHTDI